MSEKLFDVFLAHNSKDKPLIREIHRKLQARGIKPWLDEEEIAPGKKFQVEIQRAIGKIKTAAVFIGETGLGKWQGLELDVFIGQCIDLDIPVIPVLLPGVEEIPESLLFLKQFHAVAFRDTLEDKKALYFLEWGITGEKPVQEDVIVIPPEEKEGSNQGFLLEITAAKELEECSPAKLLYTKNIRDPERWAYTLAGMQKPEVRVFELMWRIGSHGAKSPTKGELMILHQRAKVTHIVEFLDDEIRENEYGFFRWVQAVWLPDIEDWYKLPHQKEVLLFNPNYTGGSTHSLKSPNFLTFRKAWKNLEDFQQHIFKQLAQEKWTD